MHALRARWLEAPHWRRRRHRRRGGRRHAPSARALQRRPRRRAIVNPRPLAPCGTHPLVGDATRPSRRHVHAVMLGRHSHPQWRQQRRPWRPRPRARLPPRPRLRSPPSRLAGDASSRQRSQHARSARAASARASHDARCHCRGRLRGRQRTTVWSASVTADPRHERLAAAIAGGAAAVADRREGTPMKRGPSQCDTNTGGRCSDPHILPSHRHCLRHRPAPRTAP